MVRNGQFLFCFTVSTVSPVGEKENFIHVFPSFLVQWFMYNVRNIKVSDIYLQIICTKVIAKFSSGDRWLGR